MLFKKCFNSSKPTFYTAGAGAGTDEKNTRSRSKTDRLRKPDCIVYILVSTGAPFEHLGSNIFRISLLTEASIMLSSSSVVVVLWLS